MDLNAHKKSFIYDIDGLICELLIEFNCNDQGSY